MPQLPYLDGMVTSDGIPVPVSFQGGVYPVFRRVSLHVHEGLEVLQPGAVVAACNPPEKVKMQSLFEKDPVYLSSREQFLMSMVIGSSTGPPSLRFPPKERWFDKVMHKDLQYHEVSGSAFSPTKGEASLIGLARSALEEVFDDGGFCLRLFSPHQLISCRGMVAGVVRDCLSSGVLVGVSYYWDSYARLSHIIYDRVRSTGGDTFRSLEVFNRVFEEEEWPRIRDELKKEQARMIPFTQDGAGKLIN